MDGCAGRRWKQRELSLRLPAPLAALLRYYLQRAHAVACRGDPHLFTDRKARPMLEASQLTHHWSRLLRAQGCKLDIPPHR